MREIPVTDDQRKTMDELPALSRVVGTAAGMPVVQTGGALGEFWALTPVRCEKDKPIGRLRASKIR